MHPFYLETRGGNFARERLMKRATTHRVFVKMGLWDGTLSERINRAFTTMQEAEIIVQWNNATPSSRVHLTRCLLACFAISLLLLPSFLGFCSWDFSNNLENTTAPLNSTLARWLPGRNTKFPLRCYSTLERKKGCCSSDFNSFLLLSSLFKLLRIQSVILPPRDE